MKSSDDQVRRYRLGQQTNLGRCRRGQAWTVLLLLAMSMCGCTGQPSQMRPQIGPQQYASTADKDEMAEEVRGFTDYFRATVERAATEIEQNSTTREQQQSAAQFRVRLAAQCRTAASQTDPGEALLDLWTLAYRTQDYLSTGEGRQLFGELQPVALRAAEEICTAIDEIARKSLAESTFEQARQDVIAYARHNPMREGFSVPPAESFSDIPQGERVLEQLVAIPLAPIAALGGVSRAPESVHAVARSVDRFTDTVEDFPANARWQLQLLGTNLGQTPQFVDAMDSFRQFSDSSARIADNTTEFVNVARNMPHELRNETELLLERFDASQPELRTTLGEARETAAAVSSAGDHIREAVVEARTTLGGVGEASQALEKAAQAVQVTAQEILKFVPASMKDETGQIIGKSPETSQDTRATGEAAISGRTGPKPWAAVTTEDTRFSFQAVTRTATELGETSDRLRGLLTDFRSFLDAKTLSSEISEVDARLRSATDFTSASMRGLVDHITLRIGQLLLLFFVLLMICRLLSSRLQLAKAAR
ncbi:MAG: hypothetical protein ACUVXJ_19055 [Phycisphaerae bacterium]